MPKTLADLKAEISDELDMGTLLDIHIARAIDTSIDHYQKVERFWFSESRLVTFDTVIGQREYTTTDTIVQVDAMFSNVSGDVRELHLATPIEMELLHDSNVAGGPPTHWAYYANKYSLYPAPDAVYEMRVLGQFKPGAPTTDAETGNVWMEHAFEALKCRAKMHLFKNKIKDFELLQVEAAAEDAAVAAIRKETGRRWSTGRLRGSGW